MFTFCCLWKAHGPLRINQLFWTLVVMVCLDGEKHVVMVVLSLVGCSAHGFPCASYSSELAVILTSLQGAKSLLKSPKITATAE
jgi:hypothetical protein